MLDDDASSGHRQLPLSIFRFGSVSSSSQLESAVCVMEICCLKMHVGAASAGHLWFSGGGRRPRCV